MKILINKFTFWCLSFRRRRTRMPAVPSRKMVQRKKMLITFKNEPNNAGELNMDK
jgi:hypothetical protein